MPGDGIASGGAGATGLQDDGEEGLQRGNEDEGAWRQKQRGRSASSERIEHN